MGIDQTGRTTGPPVRLTGRPAVKFFLVSQTGLPVLAPDGRVAVFPGRAAATAYAREVSAGQEVFLVVGMGEEKWAAFRAAVPHTEV